MKTKNLFFALSISALTFLACNSEQPTDPNENNTQNNQSSGFTIDEVGHKVLFSPGNLQFNAALGTHQTATGTAQGTWRFAENPWDYVGGEHSDYSDGTVYNNGKKCRNYEASSTYDGWIDRFCWATSGYDNTKNDPQAIYFQPWIKDYNPEDYKNGILVDHSGFGPSKDMTDKSLRGTSANYDWGVFNAISNGGNKVGKWRTLTANEWRYIIKRNDEQLFGPATINDVPCLVLLPDNWKLPQGLTFQSEYDLLELESNQDKNADTHHYFRQWDSNVYNIEQWTQMANAGAVCLPISSRYDDGDSWGIYWTSSNDPYEAERNFSQQAQRISYGGPSFFGVSFLLDSRFRTEHCSVRLVQDIE